MYIRIERRAGRAVGWLVGWHQGKKGSSGQFSFRTGYLSMVCAHLASRMICDRSVYFYSQGLCVNEEGIILFFSPSVVLRRRGDFLLTHSLTQSEDWIGLISTESVPRAG